MKRIAIVVQRYGREFAGGSEYVAHWLATRLKNDYEIEVLSTTAIDAVTWDNHYEAGEKTSEGIVVRRFPVIRNRNYDEFTKQSNIVFSPDHSLEDELVWINMQGPVCPDLIKYIEKEYDNFDLFIFMTYLYYPTYFGLHRACHKSIFIPTAHEELPIFLTIYRHIFWLPAGIVFMAEEEKDFVLKEFHPVNCPWIVGGIGITDMKDSDTGSEIKPSICDLTQKPYIFSCGRIEAAKGYEQLIKYFLKYSETSKSSINLILAGNANMEIPESEHINYLGYISEHDKNYLTRNAAAVLVPSPLESLSLVALEAWYNTKAVIANGQSRVLRGHIERGGGGSVYNSYEEFENCLLNLEQNPEWKDKSGVNGHEYVIRNYSEQKIFNKYRIFIENILSLLN